LMAADVSAAINLPPFDNSAMDGYALRATDSLGASTANPIALKLIGKVAAGESFKGEVTPGTCVRIFTGSPLPSGADAVIMQEDTRLDGKETVLILDEVGSWESVRFQGEDVKTGATLVRAGDRITAAASALAGAAGISTLSVHHLPRVAVLATGSELQEPGTPLQTGKIFESNRAMIAALVASCGGTASVEPIVCDTVEDTKAALHRAFDQNDAVITSGGVSVGEFDHVKDAFGALGGKLDLWRVALKPGKPFVFGQLGNKLLFGLPGNPVSSFVTFLLLVRPALLRMQGATELDLPAHPAPFADEFANPGDRRHFIRVCVERDGTARLAGTQGSHILSSLAAANGLVDVPPATILRAGNTVNVLRWEL
jgi:molybdopterin molybdotransferase